MRQRRAVARAGPTGLPRVAVARSLFLDMFAGACGVPHAARKLPQICGSADIMINAGLVVWLKSWVGFVAGVYAT